MKNIVFCGYRDWAYQILTHAIDYCKKRGDVSISDVIYSGDEPSLTQAPPPTKAHYFDGKNRLIYSDVLEASRAELVIFAGWSWLVPKYLTKRFCCICIHPSDLPHFAGGSPIQNQVFAGVTESMLTIFKMDEGIDTGPIYKKAPISLLGPIEEVFEKIILAGLPITRDLISDFANNELSFVAQSNLGSSNAGFKRRKPEDSIYSFQKTRSMSFKEFESAVNVLRYPYPNFMICIDDAYITVRSAIKKIVKPIGISEITERGFVPPLNGAQIYISISDGYAVINDYSLVQRIDKDET